MRTVFADSLYWIAIVRPNDPWKVAARAARGTAGDLRIVTTDEVLTEFLAALSASGETMRHQAARMVRAILSNRNVEVIPQSRNSFLKGLELYEERGDKEYSLTDCISMHAMKVLSISEALTNDRHFEQEGFSILMKK
jgi:uncharacterized protein